MLSEIVHEKYLNDLRNPGHVINVMYVSLDEFVELKQELGSTTDNEVYDLTYISTGIKIRIR